MFRHVVMLDLTDDTSEEARAALQTALEALPAAIPQIRSYMIGFDAGLNDGNFDVVVVADFDSAEDYLVYRDHQAHQAVITDHIAPHLAARTAVQHELGVTA